MNKYLIIGCILFFVFGSYMWDRNIKLNADRERITNNFSEVQKKGLKVLDLTKQELKQAIQEKTVIGLKVDSLLKVAKVKPSQAKEILITNVEYRDSCTVPAIIGIIPPPKNKIFTIPVKYLSKCWGMQGVITSRDSLSKLDIKERISSTEASLIVSEKRRWIFWKKRSYKMFSDCGEIAITKITVN